MEPPVKADRSRGQTNCTKQPAENAEPHLVGALSRNVTQAGTLWSGTSLGARCPERRPLQLRELSLPRRDDAHDQTRLATDGSQRRTYHGRQTATEGS